MNIRLALPVGAVSLASALGFALLAWALRSLGGYPICNNDEVNWIGIAQQLDQGNPWPVSGPAFIYTVRELTIQLQTSHDRSIAWLGIAGVFGAVLLLCWGYRKLALAGTGATMAALALSSYFWAPLIEARPQQWGQILVFCGTICCWLWLHRRGGVAFFLVLPMVALTHILSHAILLCLCGVLVLSEYVENRPFTRRHLVILVVMLLSLAPYFWPEGPYAHMLRDVQDNHLRRLLVMAPQIGGALLSVVVVAIVVQRRWYWRPAWSERVARAVLRRKANMRLAVLLVIMAALVLQATMLPHVAWQPYGGSVWAFLLYQTGNLMFVAFLVVGLHHFVDGLTSRSVDPVMGRFLIWVLVGFASLSVIAISASWWLLDTNWLLRLINYALLYAAIIAGMGMQRVLATRVAPLAYVLVPLGMMASLIFTLRPPGLIGC